MPGSHSHRGVERIDRVLDIVARASTPPRLTEIADAAGMPRSTTADLLTELRRHGYLQRSGYGYRIGRRMQVLSLIARLDPPTPIDHSRLEDLSRIARTPLALAVLVGDEILYLDSAGPRAPQRLQRVADRHHPRPALRTAAGRLLLALADDEQRSGVLAATDDREAVAAFVRESQAIVRARNARSDGLADPQIRAIAIPVGVDNDVAALVLLGPRSSSTTTATAFVPLEQAATRLQAALVTQR